MSKYGYRIGCLKDMDADELRLLVRLVANTLLVCDVDKISIDNIAALLIAHGILEEGRGSNAEENPSR